MRVDFFKPVGESAITKRGGVQPLTPPESLDNFVEEKDLIS